MILTLTDDSGRPLTTNAVAKLHRQAWATHTREARERWGWLAMADRVRFSTPVRVVVTPLHRDRRAPQDVAACAPEAKAAIDGLVDAGVIADDDPEHLAAVEFRQPEVCGVDGMRVVLSPDGQETG